MASSNDPVAPDWQQVELAETWADSIDLKKMQGWIKLFKSVFGKRQPVYLPPSFKTNYRIPKYILQEFHNLPNGNYSQRFSRGYITGFDISMLGKVSSARSWIAERLKNCRAVADVGTAGGKTAAAILSLSGGKVWGVDPSPYLLKHAAQDHPNVEFIQGTAEELPFEAERLDGISVCFVFHEMPPKYTQQALTSFNKALRMGGKVAISEPSEQQLVPFHWRDLLSRRGWLTIYFRSLAYFVYEPFLEAWHNQDKHLIAKAAGFKLVEKKSGMPINHFLLEKIKNI